MSKDTLKNKMENFYKNMGGKVKDIVLLGVLAIVLILAAWLIFHTEDSEEAVSIQPTQTEARVMRLLQEIDGVGDANVIIYETEDGVQSVAVVCEGANDLRVVMNVRSAVSAALGTEEKLVRVYLKKE